MGGFYQIIKAKNINRNFDKFKFKNAFKCLHLDNFFNTHIRIFLVKNERIHLKGI